MNFDDSYYSDEGGWEESSHVFLQGNRLPQRWTEFNQAQKCRFSIIETGFGSGLNFFNVAGAWMEFQQSNRPDFLTKLTYTSIEGFPLSLENLSLIISKWPVEFPFTRELLDDYPLPVKGIYSFQFDSIELNLIFMPLDRALDEYEPKGVTLFDCLFLDGFSPAKNEAMWHPANLRRLSYLCHQGASFSTFTAASDVRRCLMHCGFNVIRQKGFGRKRQMLTGIMDRSTQIGYKPRAPWYHYRHCKSEINSPVTIIGGGVAGCASANALARRGIKCLIIEQADDIGGTVGRLDRSLYSPYLSADFNLASQFYWLAYHHLVKELRNIPADYHQQCGVLFIADDDQRKRFLSAAYHLLKNFENDFLWISENETESITGLSIGYPGLFTRYGGWLNGQYLCRHLIRDTRIALKKRTTVSRLDRTNQGWQIQTNTQTVHSKYVVICTGWANHLIDPYDLGRFDTIKGQATSLTTNLKDDALKVVLNNGHYVIPGSSRSNDMIVGASFEKPALQSDPPTINADMDNLSAIRHLNAGMAKTIDAKIEQLRTGKRSCSHSGLRLTTRDHLPLIGPVPDIKFFRASYPQVIQSGRLKNCPDPQYIPGLFVNTAHGSRGVTASLLSGRLISALITGGHRPLTRSLFEAVHPARFFVRDLQNKK